MRKFLFVAAIALVAVACGKKQTIENWAGVMPAADCAGIKYELTLNYEDKSEGTYALTETYLEAADGLDVSYPSSGKFELYGDVLTLTPDDATDGIRFKKNYAGLTLIGLDSEIVVSEFNYTLTKVE